jgi:hypothetical protein
MHRLFAILLICLFIPFCQTNVTYVFTHIPTTIVQSLLNSNGFLLTNSSYVTRLLTSGVDLINSIQTFLTATDTQSVAFSWNTGDCSFPSSLAITYPSINISSPICFTEIPSSITNLLQLTSTSQQLASAATIFMQQYSLTYFSIIISLSSDFYSNLAQEFSIYLTENSFVLQNVLFLSNFTSSSLSSTSKG